MALIAWKDEYSVGVAEFDEDHRQLIEIINALHDAFQNNTATKRLEEICDELITHTIVHFGHEEAQFENYPRAPLHRQMHKKLKQRIEDYRSEIGTASAVESAKLITDWLAHHINGEDKTFGAWLNAQGIH
jgi:hemerythrin